MAILANRVRTKNSLLELSKFIIYSMKRFLALVLILISCYLLYFLPPKLFVNNLLEVVGRVSSVVSLIYKESIQNINFIYNRFSYFKDLETENLKLKLDVASLKNTNRLFSKIEWENRSLKKILHVTKEVNNNSVTAKIIGISATPFASYATIQGGTEDNINVNDIVRGAQGLIGRVSEVSNNYSTIMLINDHNSRIPVITNNSKSKGILAKQNDNLRMIYLKDDHTATVGEVIYTSGDGKIYPKGIAVAIITQLSSEAAFVKLVENFDELEFVVVESRLN